MGEEPKTEDQKEVIQKERDEFIDQVSKLCGDKMETAVFLAIPFDDGEPYMWYKGNMLSAGEMAAKFTRLVKAEVMSRLNADR